MACISTTKPTTNAGVPGMLQLVQSTTMKMRVLLAKRWGQMVEFPGGLFQQAPELSVLFIFTFRISCAMTSWNSTGRASSPPPSGAGAGAAGVLLPALCLCFKSWPCAAICLNCKSRRPEEPSMVLFCPATPLQDATKMKKAAWEETRMLPSEHSVEIVAVNTTLGTPPMGELELLELIQSHMTQKPKANAAG